MVPPRFGADFLQECQPQAAPPSDHSIDSVFSLFVPIQKRRITWPSSFGPPYELFRAFHAPVFVHDPVSPPQTSSPTVGGLDRNFFPCASPQRSLSPPQAKVFPFCIPPPSEALVASPARCFCWNVLVLSYNVPPRVFRSAWLIFSLYGGLRFHHLSAENFFSPLLTSLFNDEPPEDDTPKIRCLSSSPPHFSFLFFAFFFFFFLMSFCESVHLFELSSERLLLPMTLFPCLLFFLILRVRRFVFSVLFSSPFVKCSRIPSDHFFSDTTLEWRFARGLVSCCSPFPAHQREFPSIPPGFTRLFFTKKALFAPRSP